MSNSSWVKWGVTEHISSRNRVDWLSQFFLIFQIIYGGRILDEWDRCLLHTYLNEYFSDSYFDKLHAFGVDNLREIQNVIEKQSMDNAHAATGLDESSRILFNLEKAAHIWRYFDQSQSIETGFYSLWISSGGCVDIHSIHWYILQTIRTMMHFTMVKLRQ